MAWMLADSAAMGVQYGSKAALCAALVPVSDPLPQFAAWTKEHYGPSFGSSCYYSTACLSDVSMMDQWIAADWQWVSQCCRELAYWQVAYDGSQRSAAMTLDYFNAQCRSAFGFDPIKTNPAFNARFGRAAPTSNHTIALNGKGPLLSPAKSPPPPRRRSPRVRYVMPPPPLLFPLTSRR